MLITDHEADKSGSLFVCVGEGLYVFAYLFVPVSLCVCVCLRVFIRVIRG